MPEFAYTKINVAGKRKLPCQEFKAIMVLKIYIVTLTYYCTIKDNFCLIFILQITKIEFHISVTEISKRWQREHLMHQILQGLLKPP